MAQHVRVEQVSEKRIQPHLVQARDVAERVDVHPGSVHGCGPHQRTRTFGQRIDPREEEVGQLVGHDSWAGGDDLLSVERVAPRSFQHGTDQRRSWWCSRDRRHDAGDAGPAQGAEVDASAPDDPPDLGERLPGRVPAMQIVVPDREHEQQSTPCCSGERDSEISSGGVRPVQVFQHEQHRPRGSGLQDGEAQVLEEVALLPSARRRRVEECPHPPRQGSGTGVLDPAEEHGQRLDHRSERDPGLDVETVAHRDRAPEPLGAMCQVGDQSRLADPGITADHDNSGAPPPSPARVRRPSPQCPARAPAAEKVPRSLRAWGPPP